MPGEKTAEFILMYMDRSIPCHEAFDLIGRLRQNESSGWKRIGSLKACLVVDNGDADLVLPRNSLC